MDLSSLYIVDNNLAPVMSISYGLCELELGTTGNAFEAGLWQQAAAEGITVLLSTGDSGSAGCDPVSSTPIMAIGALAVSGLASSPYNIAVGGTDFNQYGKWSQYWSSTNDPTTKASALSYIPEVPGTTAAPAQPSPRSTATLPLSSVRWGLVELRSSITSA